MEESNKFYFLYDRLSPRHNWQTYLGGEKLGVRVCQIMNFAANEYHTWKNKNKYPDYQLGLIVIDNPTDKQFSELREGNFKPNNTTVKVVYSAMKG